MDYRPEQKPVVQRSLPTEPPSLETLRSPPRLGIDERREQIIWKLEQRIERIFRELQERGGVDGQISPPLLASIVAFGYRNAQQNRSFVQEGERLTEREIFLNLRSWGLDDLDRTKPYLPSHIAALQQLRILGAKGERSKLQDNLSFVSDARLRETLGKLRKVLAFQARRHPPMTQPPPMTALFPIEKTESRRVVSDEGEIARAIHAREKRALTSLASLGQDLFESFEFLSQEGPELVNQLDRASKFWIWSPFSTVYHAEFPGVREHLKGVYVTPAQHPDLGKRAKRVAIGLRTLEPASCRRARFQATDFITAFSRQISNLKDSLEMMATKGWIAGAERKTSDIILGALEMLMKLETGTLFHSVCDVSAEPHEVRYLLGVMSQLSSDSTLLSFSKTNLSLIRAAIQRSSSMESPDLRGVSISPPSAIELLSALEKLGRAVPIQYHPKEVPVLLGTVTGEELYSFGIKLRDFAKNIYAQAHYMCSLLMIAFLTTETVDSPPDSLRNLLSQVAPIPYWARSTKTIQPFSVPNNESYAESVIALKEALEEHLRTRIALTDGPTPRHPSRDEVR